MTWSFFYFFFFSFFPLLLSILLLFFIYYYPFWLRERERYISFFISNNEIIISIYPLRMESVILTANLALMMNNEKEKDNNAYIMFTNTQKQFISWHSLKFIIYILMAFLSKLLLQKYNVFFFSLQGSVYAINGIRIDAFEWILFSRKRPTNKRFIHRFYVVVFFCFKILHICKCEWMKKSLTFTVCVVCDNKQTKQNNNDNDSKKKGLNMVCFLFVWKK